MLTDFQVRCERALLEALEFYGNRLVGRGVAEDGEPYIHGQIDGTNIEIWLYPDEAEYCAGRKRRNYEVPVFGDEDATIISFVEGITRELK